MSCDLQAQAAELVAREALYLDMRRWDEWLDLYDAQAVFWMPAWMDESHVSNDPDAELSLFYFDSRAGLEDRVWRLQQQKSAASTPLLRTVHTTSNVIATAAGEGKADVFASWVCHAFHPKRNTTSTFFGRSEYSVSTGPALGRILRKKSILMNDYIPTLMDFYCC